MSARPTPALSVPAWAGAAAASATRSVSTGGFTAPGSRVRGRVRRAAGAVRSSRRRIVEWGAGSMARLVDGMNVVGARPDGWWRDRPGAMARLTAALDAFARETGDPATGVFDGRPHALPAERVDVRFATRRGPNAADDDIAALAAADAEPDTLRVA